MVRESEVREGELTVDMPPARDAGLVFVGRIRTPWKSPGCGGASGVNSQRSGLMSSSGVSSRQSRPRTRMTLP